MDVCKNTSSPFLPRRKNIGISENQIPSQKDTPMIIKVLFHTLMTIITGGLWLLGLVIWRIIK